MSQPLAELNAYIRSARAQRLGLSEDQAAAQQELASVRRFRRAWESGRTLDQLEQALARSPANAGPLNSHALVVRSLGLMGELSTDYLRRFLVYAQALQWLEKARETYPRAPAKVAKAPRGSRGSRSRPKA
jgi:hypothetical protein